MMNGSLSGVAGTKAPDRVLLLTSRLLYLMSFLDRVNIGAAKLYGLMTDLGMDSHMYTIASMIFVS